VSALKGAQSTDPNWDNYLVTSSIFDPQAEPERRDIASFIPAL